jgi:hypothetical protein
MQTQTLSRLTLLSVCLVSTVVLAACGGRRAETPNPPPSQPQATSLPTPAQPTPPAVTQAVPAVAPTQPAQAAPTATPTQPAQAAPDTLGDDLDKLLQQLNDTNSAADTLNDVSELK